jgi:NitT/TauT family transport system substrate-binding protein
MRNFGVVRLLIMAFLLFAGLPARSAVAEPLRIGHFPNITHAQALILRDSGEGEKTVGSRIEWKVFNAGPSAMEALLSGELDLAYVGPNPAVNAFMRSRGKSLKIIAGASTGGAALVVHADASITKPSDLKGKKIAAPELGNTQDVALRHWLKEQGLKTGRDVQVISAKNPEIFLFFQRKQIAAAWVPEPWLSRLLQDANGQIFIDEGTLWQGGKFPTAVLVVRTNYLNRHRDIVARFLKAHLWAETIFNRSPAKAQQSINKQLGIILGKPLPEKVVTAAYSRIHVTHDPLRSQLVKGAAHAGDLGYLPPESVFNRSRLAEIFELTPLNELLQKQGSEVLR